MTPTQLRKHATEIRKKGAGMTTWSNAEASKILKIPTWEIQDATRQNKRKYFDVEIPCVGKGSRRQYTFIDLLKHKIISEMRGAGLRRTEIMKALRWVTHNHVKIAKVELTTKYASIHIDICAIAADLKKAIKDA